VALLNRELLGHQVAEKPCELNLGAPFQTVRLAARKEMLDGLRLLNVSIDQFARLRVGEPAATLVQECRRAIAGDSLDTLPKLMEFGA
jgi:hypothetical protein